MLLYLIAIPAGAIILTMVICTNRIVNAINGKK